MTAPPLVLKCAASGHRWPCAEVLELTAHLTGEELEGYVLEALAERDLVAVAALIKLLALRDRDRAQSVVDALGLEITLEQIFGGAES